MNPIFDLSSCRACPKDCGADRYTRRGVCGADAVIEIDLATRHFGEEPVLSGPEAASASGVTASDVAGGSGTIFFSHCNLRCVYCQNWEISHLGWGKPYTHEEVLAMIFDLQAAGALNINLVSPTQYTPQLIPILKDAKASGLRIPVVWNSNAYEKVEAIQALKGLVDIWLPDFKYAHGIYAAKYSGAKDYPAVALAAIGEMWRQCGALELDEHGIAKRGLIIRHLVLPNRLSGSEEVMRKISSAIGTSVTLSIMAQYYPKGNAGKYPELTAPLEPSDYARVLETASELGFEHVFAQELVPTPDWTPEFREL